MFRRMRGKIYDNSHDDSLLLINEMDWRVPTFLEMLVTKCDAEKYVAETRLL